MWHTVTDRCFLLTCTNIFVFVFVLELYASLVHVLRVVCILIMKMPAVMWW